MRCLSVAFFFFECPLPFTIAIVVLGNGSNNKLYHIHLRWRGNRNAKVMRTRKLRGIPSCVSLRGKTYTYLLRDDFWRFTKCIKTWLLDEFLLTNKIDWPSPYIKYYDLSPNKKSRKVDWLYLTISRCSPKIPSCDRSSQNLWL